MARDSTQATFITAQHNQTQIQRHATAA